MSNNAICPIPWNHINIQQNGNYRICCQNIYPPSGQLLTDTNFASINNTSINDVRNFTEIKNLRKNMLNGIRDPLCKLCYDEDDRMGNSKRHIMLNEYGTDFITNTLSHTLEDGTIDTTAFPVKYIDIRFGNLCNLKCRYCSAIDSSLWYDDTIKLSGQDSVTLYFRGNQKYKLEKVNNTLEINSIDFKWYEQDTGWNEIINLIPDITRYYFTGGEPTINKIHFKLIQTIIDLGYAANITLEYNSNMFTVPDKLYELWSHFKSIIICCSIDGINDMANYLRPPSTWDKLEQNLDKLGYHKLSNFYAVITPTVTVYNILHILDIAKLILNKNYKNIVPVISCHDALFPVEQCSQVLPLEIKTHIRGKYLEFFNELELRYGKTSEIYLDYYSRFTAILAFMDEKDSSHLLPKLKDKTEKLDAIRNHKLQDTIPWLYDILQNIG